MPLTTQQKLEEAELALHRLNCGQSARVIVDQNGERSEFTAANAGRLQAYINQLKVELGLISTPGPLHVWM
jgi:hypothetical protein